MPKTAARSDASTARAAVDGDRRRKAWFAAQVSGGGAAPRAASAFTLLDALAAIGFAGGLAMALPALPAGVASALPGCVLALIAGLARGGFALAAAQAGGTSAAQVKTDVRARVFTAATGARPGERPSIGVTMAQVVEGVEALDGYYARFLPANAAGRLAPVIVVAAIACASPICAAILAMTFAPFIAAMALAGGAAAEESRRQFQALSRLSGLFADRVRALPTVLAFGAEARAASTLGQACDELAARTLKVLKIAFVSSAALEFFAALSVALAAVYCGFNLLGLLPFPVPEKLDLARALFILALAPEVYLPMRRLAAVYHDRQAAEACVDSLMMAQAAPRRQMHGRRDAQHPPAIRFDDVGVTYPDDDRPALKGFDLAIASGEVIALMGPTGAGKSTVLNLLLGLATATAGAITVDGERLEGALAASWAGQQSVVMAGSLAENIVLGRRSASQAAVAEVAARAGLATIPGGLDRRIDERGGGLSGGERRRLALARAMLRDAPLLLLDEPTANLDAASEAELLPVIAETARGRTTLIATHSPAVAALADRVVTLTL
jgi:ATP-binding cassette subfamily C protein CydD